MVFERILEQILFTYLGKFVHGVDKKNLNVSVFSGAFVIENVQLAPNIVEMLELPLKMEFSSIGKLSIEKLWNARSAPIEVKL